MKIEQTECSETSAHKIQTPGNYPEENIQHAEHSESLKSRTCDYATTVCYSRSNRSLYRKQEASVVSAIQHNLKNLYNVCMISAVTCLLCKRGKYTPNMLLFISKGKGKAIPLQAWAGPEVPGG